MKWRVLLAVLAAAVALMLASSAQSEKNASDELVACRDALRSYVSAQQAYYASNGQYGMVKDMVTSQPPYLDSDFAEKIAAANCEFYEFGSPHQAFAALVMHKATGRCYFTNETGVIRGLRPDEPQLP